MIYDIWYMIYPIWSQKAKGHRRKSEWRPQTTVNLPALHIKCVNRIIVPNFFSYRLVNRYYWYYTIGIQCDRNGSYSRWSQLMYCQKPKPFSHHDILKNCLQLVKSNSSSTKVLGLGKFWHVCGPNSIMLFECWNLGFVLKGFKKKIILSKSTRLLKLCQ